MSEATPYSTELSNPHGQWSVSMHEHHAAGPQSGQPTLQLASYAADQGRVGEIASAALSGYTTMGGSQPDRTPERMGIGRGSNPVTVISHRATGRAGDPFPHASVRVWTQIGRAHV